MLKILVFADLHYKKGMYAVQVDHLQSILDRAASEKVDLVIHLGDFCNNYKGSPELTKAYLQNNHNLPVYGIYGNHELESKGNTMKLVTPLLCNREVVFADADVGYWYTDIKDYRLIGLDTNYSYNEELREWEHNREASWGAPSGNIKEDSLSPRQMRWLDSLLADAAAGGKKVLVFSHAALSGLWPSSPDAPAVRKLFQKYQNTVLMAINGHLHTDHFAVIGNIPYLDVNTVHNGYWAVRSDYHYGESHTFPFTDYDSKGNPISTQPRLLNNLEQGKNTWFFDCPLSAVITVSDDHTITVNGSTAQWLHGIVPPGLQDASIAPLISSHQVKTATL